MNYSADIPLRGYLARAVARLFLGSGVLPLQSRDLAIAAGSRVPAVIKAAWTHLRQSRASANKWILFISVIAYIAVAYACLVVGALLFLASAAHADTGTTTSVFTPPNPQQDLAQNWLNYLFLGQDISSYVSPAGQMIPQATTIQAAFQTALALYSNAMLILAAVVLFYHLTAMVVETAHHGVVMGKRANQIWAPIRLVVAIGLLVPVSGGLNSGQYIVIKVAELGSGLASNVWQTFLTALAQQTPTYHAPKAPYVRKVVQDLVAMEACRLTYNYYVAGSMGILGADLTPYLVQPTPQPPAIDPGTAISTSAGNATLYTNTTFGDIGMCGGYQIGETPAPSVGADPNDIENQVPALIAKAHLATIQSLLSSGQITTVAKNVKYFIASFKVTPDMPGTPNGFSKGDNTGGEPTPSNAPLEALIASYQSSLQSALTSAMASLYDNSLQNIATKWSGQGWVSAGTWFNTIARGQGAIIDATQDGLPQTTGPKVATMSMPNDALTKGSLWITGQLKTTEDAYSLTGQTAVALRAFAMWADNTGTPSGSGGSTGGQDAFKIAQKKMQDAAAGESNSGWTIMNTIMAGVDAAAVTTGLWSSGPLAFSFTNTANPLAEVSYLGHGYLSMGMTLFAAAGASSFLTAIPVIGKVGGFASGLMVFIATIFIAGGFTLAFLVPLLPFIWFFFNVLTWMLCVLEGVVLMPVFALAHLNPEGDGLPGASAKSAYFLILNIFLRPVLMVFGLICGLLMFFVAISFLNMMFTIATAGTGASAGGFNTIAKLVFSIIYAGLAYICANHSFKAIGYLPDHALRWLGTSGHHESMGSPEHMAAVMSGVAAIGGQQAGAQLQKPGRAVSEAITSKRAEGAAEQKAAASKEVADTRHVQSLAHEEGVDVDTFKNDPKNKQYFE